MFITLQMDKYAKDVQGPVRGGKDHEASHDAHTPILGEGHSVAETNEGVFFLTYSSLKFNSNLSKLLSTLILNTHFV